MASFSLPFVSLLHTFTYPHTHTHYPFSPCILSTSCNLVHPFLSLSGCCPTSLSLSFISLTKTGTGRLRRERVLREPFFLLCDGRATVKAAEPSLCWVWSLERLQSSGGKVSLRECLHYKNTDIVRLWWINAFSHLLVHFASILYFKKSIQYKRNKLTKVYKTVEKAHELNNT